MYRFPYCLYLLKKIKNQNKTKQNKTKNKQTKKQQKKKWLNVELNKLDSSKKKKKKKNTIEKNNSLRPKFAWRSLQSVHQVWAQTFMYFFNGKYLLNFCV